MLQVKARRNWYTRLVGARHGLEHPPFSRQALHTVRARGNAGSHRDHLTARTERDQILGLTTPRSRSIAVPVASPIPPQLRSTASDKHINLVRHSSLACYRARWPVDLLYRFSFDKAQKFREFCSKRATAASAVPVVLLRNPPVVQRRASAQVEERTQRFDDFY